MDIKSENKKHRHKKRKFDPLYFSPEKCWVLSILQYKSIFFYVSGHNISTDEILFA